MTGSAAVIAATLCGCGGGGSGTAAACSAAIARATPAAVATMAVAGAVTVHADRGAITPGDAVTLVADVAGPVEIHADCSGPAGYVVLDAGDVHVAADAPAAPKGTPCGDVQLAAGATAEYTLRWQPDPTTPSGSYMVVVTVGDQAPVSLPVRLTTRPAEACRP